MILIDTAARIREAVDDPVLTRQIDESIAELRRDFMKPEFKAILETVGPNGEFIDSIPGRTINPGHSIETAWFILEEAKHRNSRSWTGPGNGVGTKHTVESPILGIARTARSRNTGMT